MSSSGAGKAVVAKHPDVNTHSSSADAAEGNPNPHTPSASSKGSSRLRKTMSSASSACTSQSEGRPAGGLNSRNRAAVRLSQLERLKAHRQSAQAGHEASQRAPGMAALERQPPSQTARPSITSESRPGERPSGLGSAGVASSMPLPHGVARTRQRSNSKGYLDRYAAACAASRRTAGPVAQQKLEAQSAQAEEQVCADVGDRTRSGASVRLSSAESRTGTSDMGTQAQEAMRAAQYNLAEAGQQGPATEVSCLDTAPLSSHGSVASQPAPSADGHLSTSESGRTEQTSQDQCTLRVDSIPDQADVPGLAEAEPVKLPSDCPQAPGKPKPLPQADAPVRSPHTHPEGSHALSPSPARQRSPLPAPGMPAGTAGVLFVQPSSETPAVQGLVGTVDSIKGTGQQALPAQAAGSSLQRLVNLHAYAAAGPTSHGDAVQQPCSIAIIPDLGPAKAASLNKLRSPLTSVEEGPAHQFWEVQKRVAEVTAEPSQQRPRSLPRLLAGLCSCFAPQPHASPEPAVVNLCMTPGMPGSGEIFSAALDCSEPIEEEIPSILDSQPDMEPQPPPKRKTELTAAASLGKQASLLTAVEKQPSLPKAAREQDSIPAGLQNQGSTPASQQQQSNIPAGLQQQKQQESNTPGPEVASSWSPPPDQELVPLVSSTVALFDHALPGGSGQADAVSQDCIQTGSDRVEPALSAGENSQVVEEEQVQGGATLQTQTSLAELLQSEDSAVTAPVQRINKRTTQGGKEDVSKRFVPGSGAKNSLNAFLERRHPGVPSVLLDPKLPAPWRSSPSRTTKPSPKQAPAPRSAGSACPKEEFSPRHSSSLQGQGSPLHVPAYQREGSPAQAALAKSRDPKQMSWKQTQAWSPAKTSIALVRSVAKHPIGVAISIACTAAPGQAAELASQRVAAADTSAPRQPATCQDKQPRKQATPAGKRAVHATVNQLHVVSQAGRTSLKSPQSAAPNAVRQPAVPAQTAVGRSGRLPGGRSTAGADAAQRRCHAGRAMQGQGMPHLQAAMLGPGLRTNALLESGGSMGSGQSMQCSRVAMQSIGEAQRAASQDRSRSVASTRAPAGTGSSGVTALERRALRQYLSARQLRDKAAAERGVPSPSRRYSSNQPPLQQQGAEAGGPILPESSARANTGLSASLEEELQDLERHWEDLDRADAQDTAQAQPTAHGMEGYDDDGEEEQRQAQKKVASVIEHWESRSISADAQQYVHDCAASGQRSCSTDGSASDAASTAQASKGGPELSLTYAALDMLEQLSSPAEKLAGPELREGADQPEPSSKVSTDMDSICEARSLPDSHSPLGSATSSLSHRGPAARSAEKLPFAGDSSLMAAVTAAASPVASLTRSASLTSGVKPQKLADTFSTLADDPLTGSPRVESLDSSEHSLIAAHPGTVSSGADQLSLM